MTGWLSSDGSRGIQPALFGFACFERVSDDGSALTMVHRGLVATRTEADEWLSGGRPKRMVGVYGPPPAKEV